MPKVNRTTDRAHVIMTLDLAQRDFEAFISEITKSKFFPNLIGLEVKRPNFGNPVIGLGALLINQTRVESVPDVSVCNPSNEVTPVDEEQTGENEDDADENTPEGDDYD